MRRILLTTTFIVIASFALAQEMISTGAANFLTLPTDARTAAMAGAGVALPGTGSAVFHNAASVYSNDSVRGAASYTYSPWMRDFASGYSLHALSGFYKINDRHAIVVGFRYFGYPSVEVEGASDLKPKEWAVDLGYAYRIMKGLSASVTLRYVKSSLGAVDSYNSADAFAFDIGVYYHHSFLQKGEWSAGVQLSNVGSKLSYLNSEESLPAVVRFGGAASYPFHENHRLTLAADVACRLQPSDVSTTSFSLGAEYVLMDMLALRGGYHYGDEEKADYSYATAGVGVSLYGASVDFSWLFADMDCTFRNSWWITLGYCF